jgi:hypothetical protein
MLILFKNKSSPFISHNAQCSFGLGVRVRVKLMTLTLTSDANIQYPTTNNKRLATASRECSCFDDPGSGYQGQTEHCCCCCSMSMADGRDLVQLQLQDATRMRIKIQGTALTQSTTLHPTASLHGNLRTSPKCKLQQATATYGRVSQAPAGSSANTQTDKQEAAIASWS